MSVQRTFDSLRRPFASISHGRSICSVGVGREKKPFDSEETFVMSPGSGMKRMAPSSIVTAPTPSSATKAYSKMRGACSSRRTSNSSLRLPCGTWTISTDG